MATTDSAPTPYLTNVVTNESRLPDVPAYPSWCRISIMSPS